MKTIPNILESEIHKAASPPSKKGTARISPRRLTLAGFWITWVITKLNAI